MSMMNQIESSLSGEKLRKDVLRMGIILAVCVLVVAFAPTGLRVVAGVAAALVAFLSVVAAGAAVSVWRTRAAQEAGRRGLIVYGTALVASLAVAVWAFASL